ncbi:MAG: amidohydrolase family protein [Solirubrobacterales bacterium]
MLEGVIDAHAHYVPGVYRDALLAAGIDRPDGFPRIPEWSVAEHLARMDALGIAASVISISSPGVHFGDDAAARDLARAVNEAGAEAVAAAPARFGLLAGIPLPDVDGALAELTYAFDELGADGIVLMTNVDGRYPGDPDYAELWAELDRRAAVVVLHPASPPGWERTALGRPRPMIEFPFDTTRCVVDLALGGTLGRNPEVKLVVPHAGSALPVLVDRVAGFTKAIAPGDGPAVDVVGLLADLHYDLAGDATPRAIEALLTLTAPERLLFGSDFPFPPPPVIEMLAGRLLASEALDERTRPLMLRENALALFPRLAGRD